MSCIEDILNEYDSSDDCMLDCKSVDIESILKENCDENNEDSLVYYTNAKVDYIKNISKLDIFFLNKSDNLLSNIIQDDDVNIIISLNLDDSNSQQVNTPDTLSIFLKSKLREQSLFNQSSIVKFSSLKLKQNNFEFTDYSKTLHNIFLSSISSQLKQNSNFKQHGPGEITSMICNESYLAFGTSKGLILIFDYKEEIQQVLGSSLSKSSRSFFAITAMDSSHVGNLVISGYQSGEIIVWDVMKGIILKSIIDLHTSSIVSIAFTVSMQEGLQALSSVNISDFTINTLSGDLDSLSNIHFVSADCRGTVYKTILSRKNNWGSFSYTAESECLLEQFDTSVSSSSSSYSVDYVMSLPSLLSNIQKKLPWKCTTYDLKREYPIITSKFIHYFGSSQLTAINNSSQTLIVQLLPTIKVIYKWDRPINDEHMSNASICLLDWTWTMICQQCYNPNNCILLSKQRSRCLSCSEYTEYLPLLARCSVNIIEILIVLLVDTATNKEHGHYRETTTSSSSFPTLSFLQAPSPSNSLSQQNDECKHYLSLKVLNSNEIPNYCFIAMKWLSKLNQMVLISNTLEIFTFDQQLVPMTRYSLSIPEFSINESAYVDTSGGQLFISNKDSVWKIQIQSCFERANQLIGTGKWLEALACISENVSKYPSLLVLYKSNIEKYILKYTQLGVKQLDYKSTGNSYNIDNMKAPFKYHYHLVADICIEYCVNCTIIDFLFSRVYNVFSEAKLESFFLQCLEPHIVNGSIKFLPPTLIVQFCEFFLQMNNISSIEKCIVYFDIEKLDINFLVKFLLDNKIYSSFLYIYSYGLNNFVEAFQIVFNCIVTYDDNNVTMSSETCEDTLATNIGYKLLIFLFDTFDSKIFPSGKNISTSTRLHSSVIISLLNLLTEIHFRPVSGTLQQPTHHSNSNNMVTTCKYPYLTLLSKVDAEGLLTTVHQGISYIQNIAAVASYSEISELSDDLYTIYERFLDFCFLIDENNGNKNIMVDMFYCKFETLILTCTSAALPNRLLSCYVNFLSVNKPHNYSEEKLIQVVQNQTKRHCHDINIFQTSLLEHNFWIANLYITNNQVKMIPYLMMYTKAMSFYKKLYYSMHEVHVQRKPSIFLYIEVIFNYMNSNDKIEVLSKEVKAGLCSEILKSIIELYHIDFTSCFSIVNRFFSDEHSVNEIIESTASDLNLQFKILDALLQNSVEVSGINKVNEIFQMKNLMVYFSLLCTFQPIKVLKFLQIFENTCSCPVDYCLILCRQYSISDAVSYLMEKSGQVEEALQLLLKDFSQKLKLSRREVDNQLKIEMSLQAEFTTNVTNCHTNMTVAIAFGTSSIHQILTKQGSIRSELLMRLPAYKELEKLVLCISDLCSRSTLNETKQQAHHMWLTAFDYLLLERQTIRSGIMSSSGEVAVALVGLMLQQLMDRMNGIITPQDIIRRVTAQGNATGIRLGEFKDMMMSMIYSNSQDLFLNHVMNDIFRADVGYLHKEKIKIMRRNSKYDESYQTSDQIVLMNESITDTSNCVFLPLLRSSYNKSNLNKYKQFIQNSITISDFVHIQTLQTDVPTDFSRLIDHSSNTYTSYNSTQHTATIGSSTLNKTAMYIAGRY